MECGFYLKALDAGIDLKEEPLPVPKRGIFFDLLRKLINAYPIHIVIASDARTQRTLNNYTRADYGRRKENDSSIL